MRPIGFSTGALALGDFRHGLTISKEKAFPIIELSALREDEFSPLERALDALDLSKFTYVSVHAPSSYKRGNEHELALLAKRVVERGYPVILHPDAIFDFSLWGELGRMLLVENMDKRKVRGRTADELEAVFDEIPAASLCFDIGHARQVDPTMTEAGLILRVFREKLYQVHISDVNARSLHDPLTAGAILAFKKVAHLIPEPTPILLETRVSEDHVDEQVGLVRQALPSLRRDALVAD